MRAGSAALKQRQEEQIGTLVAGRFAPEAVLGQGGMGAVYRVRDIASGQLLALKRLLDTQRAQHVALFEREYHTLASLRHRHIVEVCDYGRDALGPYYSMELLTGADLQSCAPLPWTEACRILRDVCSALALVHARGLVHRDVSSRNVWRTADGQVKLIDFGALCTFGQPSDVAGTPPFVPPEAMRGQPLDQRSDLFAVGALGYWLLTGLNAFPVRSLAELEDAWKYLPLPPSLRARELSRADLPEVPGDLDALIAALLTLDPRGRPDYAAEVVDRLGSIAGLEAEAQSTAVESHLRSKRFVGREAEREQVAKLLRRTAREHGASVCVEGEQGIGRTRFLTELALDARLAGCTVIECSAALHDGVHGLAIALAHKLLQTLPQAALAAGRPIGDVLGHLAPSVMEAFGLSSADLLPMPQIPGEARMRVQSALQDWFLAVTHDQPLAIFIDDLQTADEASLSWLLGLTHHVKSYRLLLVVGMRREEGSAPSAVLSALQKSARSVPLSAFDAKQTELLLGSIFGQVPHLARLVDVLHRTSQGAPGHCLQLAEHLLRTGAVRFAGGSWALPADVDESTLPHGRAARLAAQLERLSENARRLARTLSVNSGLFGLDVCSALSELSAGARVLALEELVREGILTSSAEGYRFAHAYVRSALCSELTPDALRRAHRALGTILQSQAPSDPIGKLRAGYHLLLGTEEGAALDPAACALVARSGVNMATVNSMSLPMAAAMLEDCLAIFKKAGRSNHELIALLAPLAVAGYYADRQLGARHGDAVVAAFQDVLGLSRARRLQRYFGAKLGLYLALIPAAIGFRRRAKNPCVPTFREAMVLLFAAITSLAGIRTICIDADGAARLAETIKPLTALGTSHAASLIHEFCVCLSGTVRDRLAQALARWQTLLARLEDGTPIKGLPDDARNRYRTGAMYASGVLECWRDDSRALELADRLDTYGMKLYQLSADQLRLFYYANQGNFEQSEMYRAKVELHAIQCGTAWQVEIWSPGAMITVHLRTYDAMRLKRCAEELEHLSQQVPSLQVYTKRARGAYLLVRGKPEQALPWLGAVRQEQPLAIVGWARSMGALARAHNELGQHAQALEVCDDALAHLTDADRGFAAMNLIVEIERAVALAGLGKPQQALTELQRLLALHQPQHGPLTLGALHEALAKTHALTGDPALAAEHQAAMEHHYRATKLTSLIERCERLAWNRNLLGRTGGAGDALSIATSMHSVVHRIRHGGETSSDSGAGWALQQLASFAQFEEGHLFLRQGDTLRCVASLGAEAPSEALSVWTRSRLADVASVSSVTAGVEGLATLADENRTQLEGQRYYLATLGIGVGVAERVIGAVVVREPAEQNVSLPFDVVRAIAARVQYVTTSAHTSQV